MKREFKSRIDERGVVSSGVAGQTFIYGSGGGNADQVDGIDADRAPRPGRLLPLNENSQFPESVFPMPRGDSLMGWGGRTIFGPHVTHLVEPIDAAQTTIYVREPLLEVSEFLLFQPPIGAAEKMKVLTGPFFAVANRYYYTVLRNADGLGSRSFLLGQLVVSIAKAGYGYIAIDAQASQPYRPFIDILERTADSVGAVSIRARLGRLNPAIDSELRPEGYGLWTDNGYFRGVLRVMGDSRINGNLTLGQAPGPGWSALNIKNTAGTIVAYEEQMRDEHGAPWFIRRYDIPTLKIYMEIRNPTSRQVLISLGWRAPNTGAGESGASRYFLDVDASTLINEAVAGKFRVLGELSALSSNFGEAQTSALVVAAQAYDSGRRGGVYAWNLPETSPFWKKYAPAGHTGLTRGFEVWRTTGVGPYVEARHGYIDFPRGRFTWGSTDDVWLSEEGVTVAANIVNDLYSVPSAAAVRRALSWYNPSAQTYDALLSHVAYTPVGGAGGWTRSSYYTVEAGLAEDASTVGLGFHRIINGVLHHIAPFTVSKFGTNRYAMNAEIFDQIGMPGLFFFRQPGVSDWSMGQGYRLSMRAGRFLPPSALVEGDGEFGAGEDALTGHVICGAMGVSRNGVLVVHQVGVDSKTDPGNPRVIVRVGNNLYTSPLQFLEAL